jgi:hypothetical protein
MMLPVVEFHTQTGERLNLSTVETRAEVSTATLRHIVAVGRGVWCRPCQSAECAYADQIRDTLMAAGLGNEWGIDAPRRVGLPAIKHVTQYRAIRETIAACWFENGHGYDITKRTMGACDGWYSGRVILAARPRRRSSRTRTARKRVS